MKIVHYSVLKEEVADYLLNSGDELLIVDGTMGEGGHSEMFLERSINTKVIGLDADPNIQEKAKERLKKYGDRVQFVHTWFNDFFRDYPFSEKPDRILLDLGISMFHYVESERGFSFSKDEPLDMRLNQELKVSATDIVNTWEEREMADMFFQLGEEKYSRSIAKAIVRRRQETLFSSSKDLAECIKASVPPKYRHGRIHPATRCFQALRIEVNRELERLDQAIQDALRILKIGGRLGIITFHSLEDRRVKHYFREQAKKCICPPEFPKCRCGGKPVVKLLTRKPVIPSDSEIKENAASRSAKLRVCEKINQMRNVM